MNPYFIRYQNLPMVNLNQIVGINTAEHINGGPQGFLIYFYPVDGESDIIWGFPTAAERDAVLAQIPRRELEVTIQS